MEVKIMPSSINFLTDSHCDETKEKEQKQIDEFNKRTAENTVMRHQLENAQRRGRTFSSDPFIPEVVVNHSGKLKSLANSCQFSLPDNNTSSYENKSKTKEIIQKEEEKIEKKEEKRKGLLSSLKCILQVNPPHSSSDSNQSKSFDNSDHINDDAR